MVKRTFRIFIIVVLLTPIALLGWLTTTESGLHWTFQKAKLYLPGKLTVVKLKGQLIGPITLEGVEYQQDGTRINSDYILLNWQPSALLTRHANISQLHMSSLKIILPIAKKTDQPLSLPEISLPWRVTLKDLVIDRINIKQNDQAFDLQQIKLNASSLLSQVAIKELSINTNTINLNIKGKLESTQNYRHMLEVNWRAKLSSNTVVTGKGQIAGDMKRLQVKQQLSSPLQATFNAEINDLLDQLNWQTKLDVNTFDISELKSDWPTVIGKLKLDGKGTLTTATFSGVLHADAPKLDPFNAEFKSKISWPDSSLDIAELDIHSENVQFSAQGRVSKALNLDWSITATDLSDLYPQAKGQLQAKGKLTGPSTMPVFNASLNGKALSLSNYQIGAINAAIEMELFRWQKFNIALTAKTLNFKGYTLQSLNIDADTRRIKATAISPEVTAIIELIGETQAKGWHGRIERANIQTRQFNDWQLKTPGTLTVNENTLITDTLCWYSTQAANLCVSLQRENTIWQSHLAVNKLPLMLLSPWLPPDLKLEGRINAKSELQLQTPEQLLGHAQIDILPGIVSYSVLEGERDKWAYRGGMLAISLDQQGIKANSKITMNNGDLFQATTELPQAKLLSLKQEQSLRVQAQLTVNDLGLVEALIPEVQDLQGKVALNFSIAGTLAQPRLTGQANLLNGAFRIPRLGVSINELTLQCQSDALEKLNFRLDAQSGNGKLAIVGQTLLDKTAGWPTEISVKGDQFEISRIPEAQVQISPNLQIKLKKYTLNIEGDIHVPYAKLQPRDITTAAHTSKDAVIIDTEQTLKDNWLIFTRVKLTLGEQVSFYGFGFEGRLGGGILLTDKPGQLTMAIGELNIPEGRYQAYGQRLEVEHGRLIYTGGPLTNPGLDLRAVRHIAEITAGIKVRGSLKRPQLELFSIPAMGQTDALAYLLLGRPMENASSEEGSMMAKATLALGLSGGDRLARALGERFGLDEMRVDSGDKGDQASLVIGRYLSPKLYISYGVGLIEAINTLTVRYRISNKWQLKAESGEAQGADIFYTIER